MEDHVDRVRDTIADIAAGLTSSDYGALLTELLAEAGGWKIQLEELIARGEFNPLRPVEVIHV